MRFSKVGNLPLTWLRTLIFLPPNKTLSLHALFKHFGMLGIQLLALLFVLSIVRSFISTRNRFISFVLSFLLALLFVVQLSSVIVTGEIADYRFYENFNIGDVLSVADFFGKEGIIIALSLIAASFLIYYLGRFFRKQIKRKSIVFAVLLVGVGVLSIHGGIVNNLYATVSLKFAGNASFDEALASLKIYKKNYVTKDEIKASKGKNIIVLSLESLEKGYMGEKLAGLTPNLRRLSKEYTLFDMQQSPAGGWTSASMYTAITGVPAFFGTHGNSVFQKSYENKITSLTDVLNVAGYDLEYFIGKKEYSGIDDMLKTLGFTVKSEKDFQEKYEEVSWGIQDKDLFHEFKKELKLKKDSEVPFALFLSTIATHFPNGVPDKRIDSLLPPQKSRLELMASATDYFVGDLVDFLGKEGMLANTVFYIYPDHLLMGTKSRVVDDFDERSLYLLTNANPADIGYPPDKEITQIDIPKIILKGAGIETNAKFLTDFIAGNDKNAFLRENAKNLLRLNDAALKTLNCKGGIHIVREVEKGRFQIKNNEGLLVLSNALPPKGTCHRILFDENLRPVDDFNIDASQTVEIPKVFAYLDVFVTNGLLYGSLKEKHQFGITKNGDQEIVFDVDDLAVLNNIKIDQDRENYIVLTSNSWNAKKPSSFIIGGKEEKLSRGLTVINFYDGDKYEFRTFDTYGSTDDTDAFVKTLQKLEDANTPYLVLAHDSAAQNLKPFSENLRESGFRQLSGLKGRQAYLAHNLEGKLKEYVNDTTVSEELLFPKDVKNKTVYFSEPKIDFEPKIDRYIAHAGGSIDGIKYTNSKEALDYNYAQGFRMFELDISETSDGAFVATHDWAHWAKETKYLGPTPVTRAEFLKHNIRGKYTVMDMKGINEWFRTHPDAVLVTDKVNDPVRFTKQFVDKQRLIMELFSLGAVKKARNAGVTALLSEKALSQIKGDIPTFLIENNIHYLGLSRRRIPARKDLLRKCRENDIKVYVYHVNFDAGKDEKYVLQNDIGVVYGMYADQWISAFMPESNTVQKP